jgi:hypothetical protein
MCHATRWPTKQVLLNRSVLAYSLPLYHVFWSFPTELGFVLFLRDLSCPSRTDFYVCGISGRNIVCAGRASTRFPSSATNLVISHYSGQKVVTHSTLL